MYLRMHHLQDCCILGQKTFSFWLSTCVFVTCWQSSTEKHMQKQRKSLVVLQQAAKHELNLQVPPSQQEHKVTARFLCLFRKYQWGSDCGQRQLISNKGQNLQGLGKFSVCCGILSEKFKQPSSLLLHVHQKYVLSISLTTNVTNSSEDEVIIL